MNAIQNSFGISLNGGYAGNGVKVGVNLDDLNENIDYSTQLGISLSNFIIGSKRVPLPIYLEVKPITIILTEKCWRDNNWNELRINLKVDNLKQALHDYPSYTKAHINQGTCILCTLGLRMGYHKGWFQIQETLRVFAIN